MKKYFFRLSAQDRILFAKRLSILLKAGVPIVEALKMLKEQTQNSSSEIILDSLITDVQNGQLLSHGLVRYKKLFGDFAINIIKVGEASGQLHENLHYLAQELQKRQQLQKKVIAALVYPAFVVAATIIITVLLTLYVFPKILPVFQSFHFVLPWTTRTLMFFTNTVLQHFSSFIIFFAILVAFFLYSLRLPRTRMLFDRNILRLPLLGNMFRNYYAANVCRTFGLLLESNVRIVDAVTITARTTSNLVYRRELKQIAARITRGEKISNCIAVRSLLFPPVMQQMISVGESTGNLSNSLLYVAEIFENEVDDLTKNLSSLIEPLLMIGMGLAVGFVAISIITPIYEITQNLHP